MDYFLFFYEIYIYIYTLHGLEMFFNFYILNNYKYSLYSH